jgi:SNF2 family DNA or RNA helicase
MTQYAVKLDNFGNGKTLMMFQAEGLMFLDDAGGNALIADQPGLGKTIEALAYLALHPDMRPVVIVCPASLKINWQREIDSWMETDEIWVIINSGKPYNLDNAGIVIINYDILKKWLPELQRIEPQILIADESHMLKSKKSQRSKAAKELAAVVPHKILLTGTPVLNRPSELWNQLQIIEPNEYASSRFFNWHLRYAAAHKIHIGYNKTAWDFSGASNLDELAQSLKSIMIRRTKEQVLPELPAKRRSTVLIPIDNRKEYDRADKEFMAWLTEQKGAEAAERASHVEQLAKREYLKQVAIKGKMKAAIDWIKTFLESGEKLIVFGTHRSTIESVMSEFSDCAVSVIGGMTAADKDRSVDAFQNDPDVRLFVGNIQAAGVGLTLTAASNVAFLELADGPEMLKQCEDRAHRIGQDNAVNCWYLLAENTIDGKIVDLVESKREVIDQITEEEHGLGFDLFDLIKED